MLICRYDKFLGVKIYFVLTEARTWAYWCNLRGVTNCAMKDREYFIEDSIPGESKIYTFPSTNSHLTLCVQCVPIFVHDLIDYVFNIKQRYFIMFKEQYQIILGY